MVYEVVTPADVRRIDPDMIALYAKAISFLIKEKSRCLGIMNNIQVPIRDIRDRVNLEHRLSNKQYISNDSRYLDYIVSRDSPFRSVGWRVERVTGNGDRDSPVIDYLLFSYPEENVVVERMCRY